MKHNTIGHLASVFTIFIWGTTFVSTKILLLSFNPIEILFIRFILGFVILYIVNPKRVKVKHRGLEKYFVLAGLLGICLYYLIENISLTYTNASNVGIIISTAPFFTALINKTIYKNNIKIHKTFYIGFVLSIIGVFFVSIGNSGELKINIIGDLLALLASLIWGLYSVVVEKISSYNYNIIFTTRRIFLYGILFMIPVVFIFGFDVNCLQNLSYESIFNLLYLGIGASALCFITWNFSVKQLGSLKTSVYIYLVPVITIISSAIVLKEELTAKIIFGTILTISGLFISQVKRRIRI